MKIKTVNQVFRKGTSVPTKSKMNKDGSPVLKPSMTSKILRDASSLIKKESDITKLTLGPSGSQLSLKHNAKQMANMRRVSPPRNHDQNIFSPAHVSHGSDDSMRNFTGIGGHQIASNFTQ